jgi:hypothetical protein
LASILREDSRVRVTEDVKEWEYSRAAKNYIIRKFNI